MALQLDSGSGLGEKLQGKNPNSLQDSGIQGWWETCAGVISSLPKYLHPSQPLQAACLSPTLPGGDGGSPCLSFLIPLLRLQRG